MSRQITAYLLREQLKPFGFFLVVFTGLVWLTQSLRVIETVVNSGQTAGVFLQFTLLLLPSVLAIVLPIAAFAATLYAINRLFSESELVAMTAAGMSGVSLAIPVALFGAGVGVLMAVSTLVLGPLSQQEMRTRVHDLRADVANALVFEGRFLNPTSNLTLYVRRNSGGGELEGVFVHDTRDPGAELTYTARRAVLARGDEGPRLVMFDGAAQRLDRATEALSVLSFETLVFDLSQFMSDPASRNIRPSERYIGDLLSPDEEALATTPLGRLLAEGHDQLSGPLYAVALPLVGLAAVLGPGFTRRGYVKRMAAGVGLGMALRVLGFAAKSVTGGSAMLWPLLYAPPVIGIAAALWVLSRGSLLRTREARA